MNEVTLPYFNNAKFKVEDIVKHFNNEKINFIIVGSTQVTLENHPNQNRLMFG